MAMLAVKAQVTHITLTEQISAGSFLKGMKKGMKKPFCLFGSILEGLCTVGTGVYFRPKIK